MTPDRSLVVKLSDDMHRAFRVRSAELGIPMSEIVRDLIQAWLEGRVILPAQETGEN